MDNYFQVGISFEKTLEYDMQKKVTEQYLFDAFSFTDAEAMAIEYIKPIVSGEFSIKTIKRAGFSEVFLSTEENRDRHFKCKVAFITLDEKSGKEKKTNTNMLVQASDTDDAIAHLNERMKGTLSDYEIVAVAETNIMDVYKRQSTIN